MLNNTAFGEFPGKSYMVVCVRQSDPNEGGWKYAGEV